MYALIGSVRIKPGHEEETAAMARDRGPSLVSGMSGSKAAYWARPADGEGEVIQHSFWLFETEADARAAETTFNSLRQMPEAPAELVSAHVCEVIASM
jgi:heme-degrading monooxygenase HmoA